MNVCDFTRSFVTFRIDMLKKKPRTMSQPPPFTLNNARLQLECVCRLTPPGTAPIDFVLSCACKGEQVNVKENAWHEPASDMCMIASHEHYLVLKSWDRNNRGVMLNPPSLGPQPERQIGVNADNYDSLRIDVRQVSAQLLETTRDVVQAGLDGRAIVSQTEFTTPDGIAVWLEYPFKTLNISEREEFYQCDTGPVLVPDAGSHDGKTTISLLRRAFVAHNQLGCTEFLIEVPTPIGQGLSVNHYSKVMKVQATNRMYAV